MIGIHVSPLWPWICSQRKCLSIRRRFFFFLYCWSWGRTLNPAMFASTWYSVTTAEDLSPACSLCCRGCLQWIQGSEDGTILFILNMLLCSPCVACHLPIAHGILTFLVHLRQGLFLSAPCPVNNGIALVFLRPKGKANISALLVYQEGDEKWIHGSVWHQKPSPNSGSVGSTVKITDFSTQV